MHFDQKAALANATRVFWEKGFHATSIPDSTQAMEIGSPGLYAAFGSKEALYVEALDCYRDTYDASSGMAFYASTAREAIKRFLLDSAAGAAAAACPSSKDRLRCRTVLRASCF